MIEELFVMKIFMNPICFYLPRYMDTSIIKSCGAEHCNKQYTSTILYLFSQNLSLSHVAKSHIGIQVSMQSSEL